MFYKTKLDENIEEFKNKDGNRHDDIKILTESIFRYNKKYKYLMI